MSRFNGSMTTSDTFEAMNQAAAERKAEREAFVPATVQGCICEGNVLIDGVEYVMRDPCCLIAGHGLHSYQAERRALDGTAREVGKVHAAHRSES